MSFFLFFFFFQALAPCPALAPWQTRTEVDWSDNEFEWAQDYDSASQPDLEDDYLMREQTIPAEPLSDPVLARLNPQGCSFFRCWDQKQLRDDIIAFVNSLAPYCTFLRCLAECFFPNKGRFDIKIRVLRFRPRRIGT
jgi:hypothetical protein